MKIYHHPLDWECSNFIGDEFIVTSHTDPNIHETTFLYKVNVKNNTRKPFMHKWCKDNQAGLEDVYWLKIINGYDYFGAEIKKWSCNGNGEQNDSGIFKAPAGTDNYKLVCKIKPEGAGWQSYSISSLVFKHEGGRYMEVLYEGRYRADKNDYKVGQLTYDLETDTVTARSNNPIFCDRLVCDDLKGNRLSGHRRGTATHDDKSDIWHAVVYKLVGGIWKEEYEPKDQDGRVGEYYFDGHYWKSNDEGMWKFTLQPNGGNMIIPKIIIEDDVLEVVNPEIGKVYNWQVGHGGQMSNWGWLGVGVTKTIKNPLKVEGNIFWCYKSDSPSKLSNIIKYEECVAPPPPPVNNDIVALANDIKRDLVSVGIKIEKIITEAQK